MNHDYEYVGCCTQMEGGNVQRLNEMIANEQKITLRTFRQYAHPKAFAEILEALGYVRGGKPSISGDHMVGFYKSQWQGRPCVFMRHSAIEHVFVKQEEPSGEA